jgi:predicted alpha/beta-fold hydrolase
VPWLWNEDFIEKHPEAVERYVKTTTQYPTPTHGYMSQANFLLSLDTYDRLPQIKAPALVLTGARDRLIQPENSKILASRIPGAELATFEKAGHGFISDTAEESSEKIIQFLKCRAHLQGARFSLLLFFAGRLKTAPTVGAPSVRPFSHCSLRAFKNPPLQ